MYFTTRERVGYCDCDGNNLMRISTAMKFMQQTSSLEMAEHGFSIEKLFSEGITLLLSKMCIKIHRMPACSETIIVGTAPITPRGVRLIRDFIIDSPAGERLLSVFSLWILVDPRTHKILRPAAFPYDWQLRPSELTDIIGDIPFPKNTSSEIASGATTITHIPIRYSHIDLNHHVNNTIYADFACDALPYDQLSTRRLDTFALAIKNESKWGDILEVATTPTADAPLGAEYYLTATHSRSSCFEALVRFHPEMREE